MKLHNLFAAGLILTSCMVGVEAMEEGCLQEKSELFDIVNHFKCNLGKYTWLSQDYRVLYSNLPSSLIFKDKWMVHQTKIDNSARIADAQLAKIKDKAKNFFKKYLAGNNILYDIAYKTINLGTYKEGTDSYDLDNSRMFLDFDYLDTIKGMRYKVNGGYSNKNKMYGDAKDKLHQILQNYINDLVYRMEVAEDKKLVDKPDEYEWELFKQYKKELSDFASKYISVDFFDNIVLPKMRKNYSYDLYREILNEIKDKYCTLHKQHKDKIDEMWCECKQNFYRTHRIFVKYRGEANLISTIVHETGHSIGDADALMENNKLYRNENMEAIALYFEILLYGDKEYKDFEYVKVDRLFSLYADLAAIISVGELYERNDIIDIKNILNLKCLSEKKRIEYVAKNRELCEEMLETYKRMYDQLDLKIASHKFGETDEEHDQSEDKKLANKLMRIFEQFDVRMDNNDIGFEFSDHTKALFHAFKVKEQAEKQKWNLDKVMCELSCTRMRKPTLEEFQKVVDWLMN